MAFGELMVVSQIWAEPLLGFRHSNFFAFGVIFDLFFGDFSQREIFALRVRQINSADGGRRCHGKILGQIHAIVSRAKQIKQFALLRVIRASGITKRRPDASVFFRDQIVSAQFFIFPKPQNISSLGVKVLGKRLGQTIRQSFGHNRAVIVIVLLILFWPFGPPQSQRLPRTLPRNPPNHFERVRHNPPNNNTVCLWLWIPVDEAY